MTLIQTRLRGFTSIYHKPETEPSVDSEAREKTSVMRVSEEHCKRLIHRLWSKGAITKVHHGNCSTACHMCQYTTSKDDGYVSLHVAMKHGKQIRPPATHVSLRAVGRLNRELNKGEQASHLCHQRTCINPQHIVLEGVKYNNSRKGCLGPSVAFECCKCSERHVLNLCKHTPPCIMSQHV